MAITSEQVFTAADSISLTGKTPTVAAVRAHLGTGSFSTITPILREWTEAQAPPTVSANPTEPAPQLLLDCLLAVAPQIWTIAADIANEHLSAERAAMDIERTELQSALADSTATGELIAADLETSQAQNIDLTATIAELKTNQAAALDEQTKARTAAEQAAAVVQATNNQLQTRIDELKADLKTSQVQNADLTATIAELKISYAAALDEQTKARTAAEQTAAVVQATNNQLQARIDGQKADLETTRVETVSLKADHAAQVKATHAAEKRAATAEAASEQMQARLNDLHILTTEFKTTIKNHETALAAQVNATHAAENRAVAAEATAAAQASQITDLQASLKTELSQPPKSK